MNSLFTISNRMELTPRQSKLIRKYQKELFLEDLTLLEKYGDLIIQHPVLGSVNAIFNVNATNKARYKLLVTDENMNGIIKYFANKQDCANWLFDKIDIY